MICPPLFTAAVQILGSGKTVCHCGNRCSWLQYDIKEQGWTCERVCVQKEQAGHLAAICMSAVSHVACCLLFYPKCVSVYQPGKVIGGILCKWKEAGWSRQRYWWQTPTLFFLLSGALNRSDKSYVSVTWNNPSIHLLDSTPIYSWVKSILTIFWPLKTRAG